MKKTILIALLLSSFSAGADLDHTPGMGEGPPAEVVALNHACFQEFERHGCGKPREDHDQFRSCVKTSEAQFSRACRSLFTELYAD